MDAEAICQLIEALGEQGSELEDVEVKTAAGGMPTDSVLESLSAFANRRGGGVILFGLSEEEAFRPVGVYDAAALQVQLAGLASDEMEPPVRLALAVAEADGRVVVAAEVPECPDTRNPCYIRRRGLPNGAYRRVGNSNRRMTSDELSQFLGSIRDDFEAEPVRGASFGDLDLEAVEEYRRAILARHSASGIRDASVEDLLRRGGFVVEDGGELIPTIAGLLVFGATPQLHFPRFCVTITQFGGADVAGPPGTPRYLFDREVTGRLRDLIVDVMETVMGRIARRAEVRGLWREDVPEYPEEVIREAVTNAVAHRSYAHRGTAIRIRIFADRIEIRNPGILFGTVTLDTIEQEQSTRNPRIAAALREFGLMEQRGTGVSLMISEMKRAGLAPPDFRETNSSFQVTLRNAHLMSPEMREWLAQFGQFELSEQQRLALAYLRLNGNMANRDFQRINSVDGPNATRELRGLVESGLLEMHGTRGGAYYTLREIPEPVVPLDLGEHPRENRDAIVELVRRFQPASRSDVARAFYGRDDLRASELRAVGRLLQELAAEGRLTASGERRGRVYAVPMDA